MKERDKYFYEFIGNFGPDYGSNGSMMEIELVRYLEEYKEDFGTIVCVAEKLKGCVLFYRLEGEKVFNLFCNDYSNHELSYIMSCEGSEIVGMVMKYNGAVEIKRVFRAGG